MNRVAVAVLLGALSAGPAAAHGHLFGRRAAQPAYYYPAPVVSYYYTPVVRVVPAVAAPVVQPAPVIAQPAPIVEPACPPPAPAPAAVPGPPVAPVPAAP